ncbi:G-type lectin S-receptor-like serine/threonine-protein kinase LECRK3 [Prunus yedoensis var. nudiflora]|uniref:G-type lectin S-receptor-like serine/threonine-protein kinase LECRK3 n=1 Tax=Prunus yedoensis var. nudiflora TaxID=2094558 RepID=A0A314XGG0_PRUYE|nr:G-type lectin S-receptor-like serine/threonine-protein kinase LECRK3 [Prunus yedoensis var. nudiflora]
MAFQLPYPLCFTLSLPQILTFSTIAQAHNNISLSSFLIAEQDSPFWASPSGDFAFVFQEIVNYEFLLAIWFYKIPERTIVWSANGHDLVRRGSKVELTADGKFMLKDIATGEQVWIADSAGVGVAYTTMLDTGNFVLANQDSRNLWESFDQPTDRILLTQTLNLNIIIFARYAARNYSIERF